MASLEMRFLKTFVCLLVISLCSIQFLDAAHGKIKPKGVPSLHQKKHNTSASQFDRVLPGRKQAYIIYMGEALKKYSIKGLSVKPYYAKMMQSLIGRKKSASKRILHTYGKSFYGCVAMLTESEAKAAKSMKGVVSVFPDYRLQLQTTRSWDFLGMPLNVTRNVATESDIIVGVLDTGIWPESDSFNDIGMGPVPAKWKGTCDTSLGFACNRKLIGAQFFRSKKSLPLDDEVSPRDVNGHGTHTASTIAGALVENANYLGIGTGTARGGVPSARIAAYKVLWSDIGGLSSDILAAFDAAIADGVDIISASLGSNEMRPYFENPVDIGAFHALKKGIFTSVAAGNAGPKAFTVTNVAPWSLTVAASTIDRLFTTSLQLGNGDFFTGVSVNPDVLTHQPLIYGGDAQDPSSTADARLCEVDSMDPTKVAGKIVLCESGFSDGAFLSGASGAILVDDTRINNPSVAALPTSLVTLENGVSIIQYIGSDIGPSATIFNTTEGNDTTAPIIAAFSSRGPNPLSPGILKPDLSAPGVAILAAWSEVKSPSSLKADPRRVPYNIISGTSMACPHATAIAVYVKSFHPTWSPSAIKSALMTTATPMNSNRHTVGEFGYGAGHINPIKALNPGLIYHTEESEYVNFLCGEGYTKTELQIITGNEDISCDVSTNIANSQLNYPSITLNVATATFTATVTRTVTNVGLATSTYKVSVATSSFLTVHVEPTTLEFKSLDEVQSYNVTLTGTIDLFNFISSALVWDDGTHQVRSPIVVSRIS